MIGKDLIFTEHHQDRPRESDPDWNGEGDERDNDMASMNSGVEESEGEYDKAHPCMNNNTGMT